MGCIRDKNASPPLLLRPRKGIGSCRWSNSMGGAQMDRMGVQTEVCAVVRGERVLHVLQCGRIVDFRFPVCVVPMRVRQRKETEAPGAQDSQPGSIERIPSVS